MHYSNNKGFIVSTCADALNAGGTTAMFDGLMNALKEIVTNGKQVAPLDWSKSEQLL